MPLGCVGCAFGVGSPSPWRNTLDMSSKTIEAISPTRDSASGGVVVGASTAEHIVGQQVVKALGITGATVTRWGAHREENPQFEMVLPNRVCQECNGKWMRKLDNRMMHFMRATLTTGAHVDSIDHPPAERSRTGRRRSLCSRDLPARRNGSGLTQTRGNSSRPSRTSTPSSNTTVHRPRRASGSVRARTPPRRHSSPIRPASSCL